jgi:hypothetical protein
MIGKGRHLHGTDSTGSGGRDGCRYGPPWHGHTSAGHARLRGGFWLNHAVHPPKR